MNTNFIPKKCLKITLKHKSLSHRGKENKTRKCELFCFSENDKKLDPSNVR